jgi:hypothetical protein
MRDKRMWKEKMLCKRNYIERYAMENMLSIMRAFIVALWRDDVL